MRTRAFLSFLALAAIVAFALSYLGSLGVHIERPRDRTRLSMDVSDINGLVVGANVLLRGVPVGEITGVSTTVQGATVDFYVDDRYRIPVDSDVRLENLSALGESYVGLVPRSADGPMLRDGQRITADSVKQPPSISELAVSVVRVLGQLDPDALHRIIGEADAALPDPVTVLPNLSRASTLLRNTTSNLNGKGRDLLDNFQTLLRNAQFVGPVLADLGPPTRQIGEDLDSIFNSSFEAVRLGAPQTMNNFVSLFARIERFLDHRSGDIKVLMESLLPYLNDISGALMNLDTGQLLDNILATVPADGAVTLHINPSQP
jgi:virulence factor Mce-like protein